MFHLAGSFWPNNWLNCAGRGHEVRTICGNCRDWNSHTLTCQYLRWRSKVGQSDMLASQTKPPSTNFNCQISVPSKKYCCEQLVKWAGSRMLIEMAFYRYFDCIFCTEGNWKKFKSICWGISAMYTLPHAKVISTADVCNSENWIVKSWPFARCIIW